MLPCKASPGWPPGTQFQESSRCPLTDKCGSLCLHSLCRPCGLCWASAFLWRRRSLVCARQRVRMRPASSKHPGHWISNELPWWTAFHSCCHNSLLGEWSTSCGTPLGKGSEKPGPGFLQTVAHVLFPFVDIALCPFVVTNHSQLDAEVLSPVSPPVNHQSWGVILGTPDTSILSQLIWGHCPSEMVLCQHRRAWGRDEDACATDPSLCGRGQASDYLLLHSKAVMLREMLTLWSLSFRNSQSSIGDNTGGGAADGGGSGGNNNKHASNTYYVPGILLVLPMSICLILTATLVGRQSHYLHLHR